MPDFTRFGKSQKEQTLVRSVALPTGHDCFCLHGELLSLCALVFTQPQRPGTLDPVKLMGTSRSAVVAVAMFTVAVDLAVNSPKSCHPQRFAMPSRAGSAFALAAYHRHSRHFMRPWLWSPINGYIYNGFWIFGGLGAIAEFLSLILDRPQTKVNLADLTLEGEYNTQWLDWRLWGTLLGCSLPGSAF